MGLRWKVVEEEEDGGVLVGLVNLNVLKMLVLLEQKKSGLQDQERSKKQKNYYKNRCF